MREAKTVKLESKPEVNVKPLNFQNVIQNYKSEMGIFVVLVLFFVVLSFTSPYFLSVTNLFNVLSQVSVVGVLAIGETIVILTAGIDLSVGATMGLSAMCLGLVMEGHGILLGILAGILVGLILGLLNGIFVGYMKLAPFIVTLGTLSIAQSLDLVISGGNSVTQLPKEFAFIGGGSVAGIPFFLILLIVFFVLGFFLTNKTKHGRILYAIGSNENATRLSGINVSFHKMLAYTLAGLLSGIGGVILSSRLMSIDPGFGNDLELDAIAAVVIGGTSLMGGKGTLIGTAIGVLLMGLLRNGLNLLGVSPFWQGSAIGSVIILAVIVERLTHRNKEN